MSAPIRRLWIDIAVFAALAGPAFGQTPDTRPPCVRVLVALEETLDSSRAKAGDVFTFRLSDPATAPDGTPLAVGTLGYGLVANATHAGSGGRGGYLALEARFFVLENGKHVPAIIDRVNEQGSTALGGSGNAPGVLGLIPIVGYAVGGYDALHHGKDATIPRGTRVGIFLGDDAALGTCRPPHPNHSSAPERSASASPSVSPSPT